MEARGKVELTTEWIARMTAQELIDSTILLFDIDPINRATMAAALKVKAKEYGIAGVIVDLIKDYEAQNREQDREFAREYTQGKYGFTLDITAKGEVANTIENYARIMRHDATYGGVMFNLLTNAPETREGNEIRRWVDVDDAHSRGYVENLYNIHHRDKHDDALRILFREREYHPVRDIIDKLQWDGSNRIEGFLARWLKCEDNDYTREVSRLIFAGGIHRIYNPGCKFDDMAVLIGTKQGEGKSTFVRWLAMEDRFFREVTEFEGQRGMEAIEGAWICEVGELLALTKVKEQEAVKSYRCPRRCRPVPIRCP